MFRRCPPGNRPCSEESFFSFDDRPPKPMWMQILAEGTVVDLLAGDVSASLTRVVPVVGDELLGAVFLRPKLNAG